MRIRLYKAVGLPFVFYPYRNTWKGRKANTGPYRGPQRHTGKRIELYSIDAAGRI